VLLSNKQFRDFVVEVKVRQVDGPVEAAYGLFFRRQNHENTYRFTIKGDQEFEIGKEEDGKWQYFQGYEDPIASSCINAKEGWNHLVVRCEGSRITAWVNGCKVAETRDTALSSGRLGVLLGAESGNSATAYFDDFKVWVID